jgi:hypothetical protein
VKKKPNLITPKPHGVEVLLDPNFLLKHALYMPDGETISKSNMTLGQAIEAIALAHIKAKFPDLAERCKLARIKYENGKFTVDFADSLESLTF